MASGRLINNTKPLPRTSLEPVCEALAIGRKKARKQKITTSVAVNNKRLLLAQNSLILLALLRKLLIINGACEGNRTLVIIPL
jgi:hypothetical protein